MHKRQREDQPSKKQNKGRNNNHNIELPSQLATIIRGEAASLVGEAGSSCTLNEVVAASQSRHVKELSSYVRAVCMRVKLATPVFEASQTSGDAEL
jgi:hypothetical protein